MNAVAQRAPSQIVEVRTQLESMQEQFAKALPAHIPVERFARVVMTAVQNNPDLLRVERRTLWNSAMKAAQDGLLPDGREGAMVVYGNAAQWMPMIAGIRKKVRNSGEIATWDAHVVYTNDAFEFELGDEPFIRHRPSLGDRGEPIAAYSIAVLKSGEKSREVMSVAEIEAIRGRSRAAKKGPWVTDWSEMARKTVARRHSKVLPMSTDLDDLIRRDDDLYQFDAARDEAAAGGRPKSLAGKLDMLAAPVAAAPALGHDAGEDAADDPTDPESDATLPASDDPAEEAGNQAAEASQSSPSADASAADDEVFPGDVPSGMTIAAYRRYRQIGRDAHGEGVTRKAAVPAKLADDPDVPEVIRAGWDEAAAAAKGGNR